MVGRRLIYLAALLSCLIFYYFYQEWFSWFALMALLWLPVLSLVLSLPGILAARGQLVHPVTVPVGQPGEISLQSSGRFPVPPFRGKLRMIHGITGEAWVLKNAGLLPTEHCGQLKLEVVHPRIYDYLGLFRLPLKMDRPGSVLVWPEAIPLTGVPDFARLPAQKWKPRPGGGFAENHELRLYRPGDSLRQIHWKLSAKTGKLILREPMEPVRRRIRLTMDLCGTPEVIDRKLGQLLWLGCQLLSSEIHFEMAVLTGSGILVRNITEQAGLYSALADIMASPAAASGSVREEHGSTLRQYHIGGDAGEA